MDPRLDWLAHGEPAAGAAINEVIIGSLVGLVLAGLVVALGVAHRTGKTAVLTRLAGFSERVSGIPGWAALPSAIAGGSLLLAVFGFYADVASHIDDGRDPGPFANPFHYFIIFGLLGIAFAGAVAILLGSDTSSSVRIRKGWKAPVGGVLMLVCGVIAVAGFPLDDMWHRLFGQDVTLWSPTHLQMVGGAALSTLALLILRTEGARTATSRTRVMRLAEVLGFGAFLLGLSAFQAEFDYSVPQFRLVFHPILLMLSAGIALVPARMRLGRGGALKAVLFFIAIRGLLSLVIGPGLGHTTPHFPLYIAEALAVEAVALFVSPTRQLTFGMWAGAAIGTFGLAGEWIWSNVWMTMPWTSALLPEAIVFGIVAGVSGGILGGFIGRALGDPGAVKQRGSRPLALATALGIVACLALPLPVNAAVSARASVELDPVEGKQGWMHATMQLDPPTAAEDAEWFNITSWQGGGSVISEPVEIGPGRYRSPEPIPVFGEWKSQVRLARGDSLMALPIYLPADPVIGAEGVRATEQFTRAFESDKELLLREAKDVDAWLTYVASAIIGAIALLWVLVLGWGLSRLESETDQNLKKGSRAPVSAKPLRRGRIWAHE